GQVAGLAAAVPKQLGNWFTVAKLELHWKGRMAQPSIQMDAILKQATNRQCAICDRLLALCEAFGKVEHGQLTAEEYKDRLLHLFVLNLHSMAKLTNEHRSNALKATKIPARRHTRFHNIVDKSNSELFEFKSFDMLQQYDDHEYKQRQLSSCESRSTLTATVKAWPGGVVTIHLDFILFAAFESQLLCAGN
ncbi:hypothetical protein H4R35_006925, partial [Dimargaris xerosporica]